MINRRMHGDTRMKLLEYMGYFHEVYILQEDSCHEINVIQYIFDCGFHFLNPL